MPRLVCFALAQSDDESNSVSACYSLFRQRGGPVNKKRLPARVWLETLATIVAFVVLAISANAQFDTATVLGTVKDPTGAVLTGATVTLKNIDTGITASVQTDGDGNFQFTNVKIG